MAVAVQRPLRGSRISSFYPVKNLPSLSSLDSAFQLQEYISLLIRLDVHDVDTIVSVPGKPGGKDKGEDGGEDLKSEEKEVEKERRSEIAVDEACWIYEQLRRLAQDLSHPLITMLQQECTRASCPEMKAGEWLYLCVAHGNDGAMEQCCAIDYILHTLDSATALLNSPRAFPSRLQIPQASHRHFSSLARRLGRIFAHAYFHHREAFEQAEVESSLYARFLALTSKFELVPPEFLVIPTPSESSGGRDADVEPPRLLAASVDRQRGFNQNQMSHQVELGSGLGTEDWGKVDENPPGLGSPARDHSPRRYGRSRTDTMVFSEAFNVAEELAKGEKKEVDGNPDQIVGEESEPEMVVVVDEVDIVMAPEPYPERPPISDLELDIEPIGQESDILDVAVPPAESTCHDPQIDVAEAPPHAPCHNILEAENPQTEPPASISPDESTISASTESSASEPGADNASAPKPNVEEAPADHIPDEPSLVSVTDIVPETSASVLSDAPPVDTNLTSGDAATVEDSEASVKEAGKSEAGSSETPDAITSAEDVKLQLDIESTAPDSSDSPAEIIAEIPSEASPDAAAESEPSS